jgi:alkanesulfonate monooxygenase SsuD/methylene tetrahydromethanopterin reductase-like flavin-dependent oxidoreductase (luciferase family)
VRASVDLPTFAEFSDLRLLARVAAAAEDAGWDGVHLWEHVNWPFGAPLPTADPWLAASVVAQATTRVQVAMMVCPLPRRLPHEVARQSTTMHELTGGRFVLGVGSGGGGDFDAAELAAFGTTTDARVRGEQLDEGLEVVLALWSGQPVHHRGRHWTADGVTFLPASPWAPDHAAVPVWVAGGWGAPRPRRRAARFDAYAPVRFNGPPWGPQDVTAARALLDAERPVDLPGRTALVLGGTSDGGEGAERLAALDEAGLDWWSEGLWSPGRDLDAALRRVAAGPRQSS